MDYEKNTWADGDIITAPKLNNIESGVRGINSGYTPTAWADGDVITAEKLNNIEDGIENAPQPSGTINITEDGTYDVTQYASVVVNTTPPTYRTVLYTDGTFIINESSRDEADNIALHGAATNVYEPYTSGTSYQFLSASNRPWHNERTYVTKVEIGSPISPSYLGYWFNGFSNCISMDLANINGANVREMRGTFHTCSSIKELDLSNLETSNPNFSDMYNTFYNCSNLEVLDISKFDTSHVVEMAGTFRKCSKLETIYASQDFDTSNVSSSNDMFTSMSTNLVGGAGTVWSSSNPVDKTYAHIDGGISDPGYFTAKS